MAGVIYLFTKAMTIISPPWLTRRVGGAIMEALGAPLETEVTRTTQGVKLRFPDENQAEALGYIGSERRIIRGPAEDAASYAARLRLWWDSHLTRGGPYALLTQIYPYFLGFLNVAIEVVANNGTRHLLDTSGNITRDSIAWGGDGAPTLWGRIWIMFNLAGTVVPIPLFTEFGEPVLTEDGDQVLVDVSIFALTAQDEKIFCAVPESWSAAHIDETHIILLYPGAELWGYRTTTDPASGASIGTWADTDPAPGQVWQATDPVDILC